MSEKPPKKPQKHNPNAKHRERMRARLRNAGLDALADHEVLEILLYYPIKRMDTNKIAHRVLKEFGSLHAVFEADAAAIMRRTGLSENTATMLSLVAPLARRYGLSKWGKNVNFASSKSLGEYVKTLFMGETVECFYLVCLDNELNLKCSQLLSRGTTGRAELYPQEIVNCAIAHRAAYVVLAHNHPSGSLAISSADLHATEGIIKLLSRMEIDVLDHIICGGDDFVNLSSKRAFGLAGVDGILKQKKALQAEADEYIKRSARKS